MIGIRPDNSGPNRVDDDHESLPCSGKYDNKRPEMNRSIMAWLANQVHALKSAKSVFVCKKDHQHVWCHTVGNKTREGRVGHHMEDHNTATLDACLMHFFILFPLISQGISHIPQKTCLASNCTTAALINCPRPLDIVGSHWWM